MHYWIFNWYALYSNVAKILFSSVHFHTNKILFSIGSCFKGIVLIGECHAVKQANLGNVSSFVSIFSYSHYSCTDGRLTPTVVPATRFSVKNTTNRNRLWLSETSVFFSALLLLETFIFVYTTFWRELTCYCFINLLLYHFLYNRVYINNIKYE